ncbi:MAG: FAD-dependent oxidoreductase [Pirellulaceae bacterium]
MKIAVVGSGISGMTAAYYLSKQHEVTVFEANGYIGGHTNTIDVEHRGQKYAVDTGFIVFNDRTYPNFIRLLGEIGVESQPTAMTFSVQCETTGLEYRGADLSGLFAQMRNYLRPSFYYLLAEMLRFNRQVERLLETLDPDISVADFFAKHRFGEGFRKQFFLPMASAIWSCPNSTVEQFPLRFIVDFYRHHGLLSVNDRPQWRVIRGGSQQYMKALVRQTNAKILVNSPIASVFRTADSVRLTPQAGESQEFDHVVFACHSDQALRILGSEATKTEQEVLIAFPYERNVAILHTDRRLLPRSRRAWACWNYHLPQIESSKATVTYNMNLLQGIDCPDTFCVSLNCEDRVDPALIVRSIEYHHPVFTTARRTMQERHHELIDVRRTSFAGAYWGNGFHEDGVVSALAVCQKLDQSSWKVASTKAGFDTAGESQSKTAFACESA